MIQGVCLIIISHGMETNLKENELKRGLQSLRSLLKLDPQKDIAKCEEYFTVMASTRVTIDSRILPQAGLFFLSLQN